MAWGWILLMGDNRRWDIGKIDACPENTNNVAEYLALYHALKAAGEERARQFGDAKFPGLVIRGDSKLVCEQIADHWSVKAERLKKAHAACLDLLRGKLDPFMTEWIPREQNAEADALSREAYLKATGRVAPERQRRAG